MQPGDNVQLTYHDEIITGTLMPSMDEHVLVLKLSSGYNIGIRKRHISDITVLPAKKAQEEHPPAVHPAKDLPIISILHTGGTIASKVDYATGGVIPKFSPEDLLQLFPELNNIATIRSRLLSNTWSQDMRFGHYNRVAQEVLKEIEQGVKGVVITHGTDTLHYTAAALSFILEDLSVPVVLVGSQRSSDRGSSDAGMNLLNAVFFAANANLAEVVICMHHSTNDDVCAILPGTKTKKMHSSRRDAFKAINTTPYALIDYGKKSMHFLNNTYAARSQKQAKLKPYNENIKVGIIKQRTHMFMDEFLYYKNYDGLVIEATGLGNLPVSEIDDLTKEHAGILSALQRMIKEGLIVVLSPETIYGRLNLNVYENARRQQAVGILGHGNDMTTETTYLKLAWLLSNYDRADVKKLILTNLRGELNERTEE